MIKYLSLYLCSCFLCANELTVSLTTKQPLRNVYLASMTTLDSPLQSRHLQSLENTLFFDLKTGGYTLLAQQTEESNARLQNTTQAYISGYWKSREIDYLVIPMIHNMSFALKIFDVCEEQLIEMTPILLTGNLAKDRALIHKISDLIHKKLYRVRGIAQKRIVFAMQDHCDKWISEIWECGVDGHDLKKWTGENAYSISPLGMGNREGSLLYVCYKHGQPKIYLSTEPERLGTPIIHLRGNQLLPAFSRNFDKLAFISDASGRADLFLQQFSPATGQPLYKPVQIFSAPGSVQASPSFSPDGGKIAFVSDKSFTPRIYIIDLLQVLHDRKVPSLECITKINRENTCPSWSPDGQKIVYSAQTDGIRQIWVYDLEKQEEVQLTTGPENKENPCFAEDSLHIVYNTTSPEMDIFMLDLHQCKPVKITRGPGKKHYPSWMP